VGRGPARPALGAGQSSTGRGPARPVLGQGGAPASAMVAQELGTPWLKRVAAGGGRQAIEGGGSASRPAPWRRQARTRARRAYEGRGGVWCGARHAAEEKRGVWRSTRVAAAGAERSRDRSPAGDTDPDASGVGGAGLLRAVREQRRRREREKDETDMRALGV
jgi:hypothetical protein